MEPHSSSSMLRSPVELAVSETGRAARECADRLRQAEKLTEDSGLAARLGQLAARHDAIAERMAEASRALGDLPRLPDADKEAVTELVRAMKSVFASDERQLLVDECIADEHALLAEIDKGLALDLEPWLHDEFLHTRTEAEDALDALVATGQHG